MATMPIPIIASASARQPYKCACAHSPGGGMFCYIHFLWFQISVFALYAGVYCVLNINFTTA